MTRSSTRSLRHTEAWVALGGAALLAATGCVTRATHERVVGELEDQKAQLEARVQDLERSNRALDEERVKLIDEMEDLRQARESLSSDVEKLTKTRDVLTEHLRKRDSEVQELSQLKTTYGGLVSELESEVAAGQIQIEQLREGIRLNLQEDILFPSGSAALAPRGEVMLRKVASKLHDEGQRIEVRGHTDNVPISGALAERYPSNWELAAARAARVVRLFESEKIDPTRLSAISYGQWQPVAPNTDAQGRARNRRIEIRLIPLEKPAPPGKEESPAPPAPAGSKPDAAGASGDTARP
jgi:chemotaxis protein MotB